MKTFVILILLLFIGYFAFKNLYLTLTGKKGCSCSSSQKSKCPAKKCVVKNEK